MRFGVLLNIQAKLIRESPLNTQAKDGGIVHTFTKVLDYVRETVCMISTWRVVV